MRARRCTYCPRLLRGRADARYCSAVCRAAHWRRRARLARALDRKCETCRKRIAIGKRIDSRYCSSACRQRGYRQRKIAASKPQRVSRLTSDLDIAKAEVQPITLAEARSIIDEPMPAVMRYCFGIFFNGRCGGAVVYGDEYAENLGVWDRYGYSGKIVALLRGACTHWAHPHAASKLIRRSMDLLPAHYKVVTATVDRAVGEIGTIYQACGFDFVGTMRGGGRALIQLNGKHISERQAGRLAGTRGALALAKLGFDAITVPRRERYFVFRGTRSERKELRAAIGSLIKPYPKRT